MYRIRLPARVSVVPLIPPSAPFSPGNRGEGAARFRVDTQPVNVLNPFGMKSGGELSGICAWHRSTFHVLSEKKNKKGEG